MIESLRRLGTQITNSEGGDLVIVPPTTDISLNTTIDCGLAGTVMRFVPPMAALFEGTIVFDGDEAARRRPMWTTIDSLRALGVNVSDSEGLPFTISSSGVIEGGYLEIDASASSQFVSGLLLAAPRFTKGLELRHVGKHLPSLPHIEMTLECLRERGVAVSQPEPTLWKVLPGPISGGEKLIEPDLSNAGQFLAAALVLGGSVTIQNWPKTTTQVGKHFVEILSAMGASFERDGDDLVFCDSWNGECAEHERACDGGESSAQHWWFSP
jgi:3-phosphoshikimate 1-carboxyvinyltransferase